MAGQGRAAFARQRDVPGQDDGKVRFGNGDGAALLAVHDGNGRPPIPLAGDAPVPQPVLDGLLSPADRFEVCRDGVQRLHVLHAVEAPGIHQNALFDIGLLHGLGVQGPVRRLNHHDEGQAVLLGELEVALVVGGHGHDAAGAVVGQHEIRGEDGHSLVGHRVQAMGIEKNPFLFIVFRRPHHLVLLLDLVDERPHLLFPGFPLHQLHDERVLRGDEHEGRAVNGVLPGGEHPDRLSAVRHGKNDLAAVAFSDPVPLHGQDPLRPPGQPVAAVQQFVHIGGDPEEPLVQVLFADFPAATPAQPRLHLLIGQNGLALGAPVHRRTLLVNEPLFVHPQEEELLPAVVLRFAGRDFPVPVVAEAHPLQLRLHEGDVLVRPRRRVGSVGDGRVLRRHAEGVPAHRVKNVEALHPFVPGHDVADGVVSNVADVDSTRGVGKHLQKVILLLPRVFRHAKRLFRFPVLLPFLFDGLGGIFFLHRLSVLPFIALAFDLLPAKFHVERIQNAVDK